MMCPNPSCNAVLLTQLNQCPLCLCKIPFEQTKLDLPDRLQNVKYISDDEEEEE